MPSSTPVDRGNLSVCCNAPGRVWFHPAAGTYGKELEAPNDIAVHAEIHAGWPWELVSVMERTRPCLVPSGGWNLPSLQLEYGL